jgi:3-deoxy-D-manno-octulosonic-acid transferase
VRFLFDLVYLGLLACASPWLIWQALRKQKYLAGWGAKFLGNAPYCSPNRARVWLHAVSVGEVQLLRALIPAIEEALPEVECVISTTTRTGMQLARQVFPEHVVFYAPLDFSWAVRRAIARVRPSVVALAELELWPNWIGALSRQGIPVVVVNGRLSDQSFRGYQRIRPVAAAMLKKVTWVAAQTDEYARRFLALGAETSRVFVTGSIKFDNLVRERANLRTQRLAKLAGIQEGDVVVLAGSTQEPEERIVLEAATRVWEEYPDWRLVIVPRHPERFEHVARLLDRSKISWLRRSQLPEGPQAYAGPRWRVLLVDTVGELADWWGTARVGFVGGSLGNRGGQNMMEPAAYGVAVSFGPNTKNFRDVVQLLCEHEAVVVVRDGDELAGFFRRCMAEPDYARALGETARGVVLDQAGATNRTVDLLLGFFQTHPAGIRRVDDAHQGQPFSLRDLAVTDEAEDREEQP